MLIIFLIMVTTCVIYLYSNGQVDLVQKQVPPRREALRSCLADKNQFMPVAINSEDREKSQVLPLYVQIYCLYPWAKNPNAFPLRPLDWEHQRFAQIT